MPRRSGGRNNPSHRRARKRVREDLTKALRDHHFRMMAEQNGLVYDQSCGFRARLDVYEWALRHARRAGIEIPHDLQMGSAMGWLLEHIQGWEAGESARITARQEAEASHEDLIFEAAIKQLLRWIPQPVPDDFVCPYTGADTVDKRKILASGTRHQRIEGETPSERTSYVYAGHDTLVVYRAGHRGKWYIAREIWDGTVDSDGNRLGVVLSALDFGEVTVVRRFAAPTPGLPWPGVAGHSGQTGRPILREQSAPRFDHPDIETVAVKTGYDCEADARKQAMMQVCTAAAVMGKKHVNLRRASRMRGGAREKAHLRVSAPASETPGERLTHTIPAHLWSGELVEDDAPRVIKPRRRRKKLEDSEKIRKLIKNNRIRALT